MYDTRLEMASDWLWDMRQRKRQHGEPAIMGYHMQPADVKAPFEDEVSEVIRAVETYYSVRDVIHVHTEREILLTAALTMYKHLHPDDWVQTMHQADLDEMADALKLGLDELRVTGDFAYPIYNEETLV